MSIFSLHRGSKPLLISMPHNGVEIPDDLARAMTKEAMQVPDTDWFLDKLYDFAPALGASVLNPRYSRYVIDLNRAPDGEVLYAGANNTELCPTSTFAQQPIYLSGKEPTTEDIQQRVARYWQPYHQVIADELSRLVSRHGYALLFEAHSIQSHVPRFFDGRLPDINFGTAEGKSAHPSLIEAIASVDFAEYSTVTNGRFKGGYITRHYGQPSKNIHAIQLELSQITYMNEAEMTWSEEKAPNVQPVLKAIVESLLNIPLATLR